MPIPEARYALGDIGRTTLYEMIARGDIVKVNIGRRGFITAESLGEYVDRLTASAVRGGAA
ncbi:helix-turn-helix domain-containing protein [Mycobacterium sp. MBM]|nr:helix-turn-helix domain-containing protein [Mycobacterium sp. MBM]